MGPSRNPLKNPPRPTPENIRAAVKAFDKDAELAEASLTELFRQYPDNLDPRHVFLKVIVVNTLYSTQIRTFTKTIPNVEDVALHICKHSERLDAGLQTGSPEIVDLIGDITVPGKEHRNFFSFASKYCSWHQPESYPIYDNRVFDYFRRLQKDAPFCDTFKLSSAMWVYSDFCQTMNDFRKAYSLEEFSLKEIDKFIWMSGSDTEAPIARTD